MALHMIKPDPQAALQYFKNKMAFTTGPIEVDYFRSQGDEFNLIDVRAAKDYAEGHAQGAINLPEDDWSSFKGLDKNKLNILYCYSQVCHLAAKAAVKFAAAGYPVMEMDGGFDAWKDHELAVEGGGAKQGLSGKIPDSAETVDRVSGEVI